MKRIDGIKDLEQFGIEPLTGESDAHMYRILCDVTARGKRIVERTMDVSLTLHDSWNGGHKDDPHIGSLLVPLEFVSSLAVFALLSDTSITEVWLMKGGSVFGFGVEDADLKDRLKNHHENDLRKTIPAQACRSIGVRRSASSLQNASSSLSGLVVL